MSYTIARFVLGRLSLEEIDGIVLNKTVNKRKNLAFVLVLDKTSRFGLAD